MIQQKKGALELSMNSIVIVVIGVTLLVLGLAFVSGVFGSLDDLSKRVFGEAENSLNQIATHTQKLTMPQEVNVKRGDSVT